MLGEDANPAGFTKRDVILPQIHNRQKRTKHRDRRAEHLARVKQKKAHRRKMRLVNCQYVVDLRQPEIDRQAFVIAFGAGETFQFVKRKSDFII